MPGDGDSHDKFRTINPQFPRALPPENGAQWLSQLLSQKISHSSLWRRKATKQFLLIYIPVAKEISMIRKVCFGFRLIHCAVIAVEKGTQDERKPWKICGVTLESSQFIVREWFSSFSFQQTNIKICFCILTSMEMVFFSAGISFRFLPIFPLLLPEWDERFFVVRWRSIKKVCRFRVREISILRKYCGCDQNILIPYEKVLVWSI